MAVLIKLVADISLWLYLGFGLLALIFLRGVIISRRERERSIFSLEREAAISRMYRYSMGVMLMVALLAAIYYNSVTLIEKIPMPEAIPTATLIVELPPTLTPVPLLPTPTPTATPNSANMPITNIVTPSPTPETRPVNPEGVPPNCPFAGSRIQSPGDGAIVNGYVQISGSATFDNFDYYKFEFRAPGGDWNFIESHNIPVQNGLLGGWNSDTVPPGTYQLRLVVVDKTGNFPDPCMINLQVQ